MISRQRASELVASFGDARVLVVGDLILDRYVWGAVSRISPEAPVPVVHVSREHLQLGGAANVARNVCTLGGAALAAGIVGQDASGDELVSVMADLQIGTEGVVRCAQRQTTVKTRVLAERQQVVRVDREDLQPCPEEVESRLASRIGELAERADAVIIEDYGKGAVSQATVDAILQSSRSGEVKVGFDPKDNHALKLSGLTLATPNYREACLATGIQEVTLGEDPLSDSVLGTICSELREKWDSDLLIVTLGVLGMCLVDRSSGPRIISTRAKEVFDVSGAGDTVIAVATLALACGASHDEAAELANHAAGVVVAKLGTATCDAAELLESIES